MAKSAINDTGLEQLDLEAQLIFASRLYAIEYFACHLLTAALPSTDLDPHDIDDMHRRMLKGLGPRDAAKVSEAHAEIALSELLYAVRRLISLQREMLGMPRRLPS